MFNDVCSHMFWLIQQIMKSSESWGFTSFLLDVNHLFRCVIALIRGLRGLCPCPKCLIPSTKLADFNAVYPERTPEQTVSKLNQAKQLEMTSKADAEAILKESSLRPIIVCMIFNAQCLIHTELFIYFRIHSFYLQMLTHFGPSPMTIFILVIVGFGVTICLSRTRCISMHEVLQQ